MRRKTNGSKRRNAVTICLSFVCAILIIITIFQTEYFKYQLKDFGLVDDYHNNTNTVSAWNSCLKMLNVDAEIVFWGDSLTRGYDFQADFPEKSIINLGLSGETILDMIERTYMLETLNPEKVFLMAGINSLKNEKMIDKYYDQYIELCRRIQENAPSAKLYIHSILPVDSSYDNRFLCEIRGVNNRFIARFNSMIRQYAKENGLTYIDLYTIYEKNGALNPEYSKDGLHITYDAYHLWIDAIKEFVNE